MITDRRAAEQLNAFVAFQSGRAAEFLYETSSQCGRRSHAWPVDLVADHGQRARWLATRASSARSTETRPAARMVPLSIR
jgi:hypothetical protein